MLPLFKQYLPIVSAQKNFRSLVEPYLRYSCPVWGFLVSMQSISCKNSKKRAARIVTNSAYDASRNYKPWLAHP